MLMTDELPKKTGWYRRKRGEIEELVFVCVSTDAKILEDDKFIFLDCSKDSWSAEPVQEPDLSVDASCIEQYKKGMR